MNEASILSVSYSRLLGMSFWIIAVLPLANSPRNGDFLPVIQRNIQDAVRRAMADTPVVLLNGARQTGKTTLAQGLLPTFQRSCNGT
jgi:hypothetical protein